MKQSWSVKSMRSTRGSLSCNHSGPEIPSTLRLHCSLRSHSCLHSAQKGKGRRVKAIPLPWKLNPKEAPITSIHTLLGKTYSHRPICVQKRLGTISSHGGYKLGENDSGWYRPSQNPQYVLAKGSLALGSSSPDHLSWHWNCQRLIYWEVLAFLISPWSMCPNAAQSRPRSLFSLIAW